MLLALGIALGSWASVLLKHAEPTLRDRVIAALQKRFHARVELDEFHLSLLNGIAAEGKGLRIWQPDSATTDATSQNDPPQNNQPMIRLDRFRFRTDLNLFHFVPQLVSHSLRMAGPLHIPLVTLDGLTIQLPAHTHFHSTNPNVAATVPSTTTASDNKLAIDLDRIDCNHAVLIIESEKPGKEPLRFEIQHLHLSNVASKGPINFDAVFNISRPAGQLHATGHFGPWLADTPIESAIDGNYTIEHADLSVFHGIAGTLHSTGRYQGTLHTITIDSQSEIPDFRLTHFNNVVSLSTRFHATVDGSNGDLHLDPLMVTLGHSHFTARGEILRIAPKNGSQLVGHEMNLDTASGAAQGGSRIEDFLRLTGERPAPLLTGALQFHAVFHQLPGSQPAHQRMQINGDFHLTDAHFNNAKMQQGIMQLSLRGSGKPDALKTTDPNSIASDLAGQFHIYQGVLTLPAINYTVPGATIQLHGTYTLDGGALDFAGEAQTQATVSKMVGGWKGFLLKSADRFLRKEGAGTVVPIRIDGTRENPKFTIDFNRLQISASPARASPPR